MLCRVDIHIDIFDDNSDTAIILAAKMNHTSVAMLMHGAGCSAAVFGEVWQMVAQRGRRARDVEENSATSVIAHDKRNRHL